jgi:hypothetical protein
VAALLFRSLATPWPAKRFATSSETAGKRGVARRDVLKPPTTERRSS